MLSEKQQKWGIWLSAKNLTHSKSMGILDYIKCCYSEMAFLEKIETWHVGLSCQYTYFMSFSSKSEHDTIADQATIPNTFAGLVGKVQKKLSPEGGRKGGWRKKHAHTA